ncbi:hypothetical protein GCM10022237_17980 [Nocardioides ginsengisoli]|uniref:Uncharacterized protein n=1 Tax=Nocardioides ginsengisoli TaxID=363868 RepID=A0ABW3W2R8_9ACTN
MRTRLVAGLAGALLAVTPAVASAAEYVHVDPAHDVRSGRFESDGNGRLDRRQASADIRKVHVSYTSDRLVVRIKTRAALPARGFFVGVGVRTPAGQYDSTFMKAFGGTLDALTGEEGDDIDCAGYGTTIDRAKRLTTVTIPSTCIGSPTWVKVGAGVATIKKGRMSADDGLSRRLRDDLSRSPRITRD